MPAIRPLSYTIRTNPNPAQKQFRRKEIGALGATILSALHRLVKPIAAHFFRAEWATCFFLIPCEVPGRFAAVIAFVFSWLMGNNKLHALLCRKFRPCEGFLAGCCYFGIYGHIFYLIGQAPIPCADELLRGETASGRWVTFCGISYRVSDAVEMPFFFGQAGFGFGREQLLLLHLRHRRPEARKEVSDKHQSKCQKYKIHEHEDQT